MIGAIIYEWKKKKKKKKRERKEGIILRGRKVNFNFGIDVICN